MVNYWEMTPWAYRAAKLFLRECWWVGFGFMSYGRETLDQLDAVVDFILPPSPTSPSKAGSRNPPPPLSPLLIQLHTVSNMTAYGERLGDDAMGIQGSRASLVGVLAGGVWFRVVWAPVQSLDQLDAVVDFILPLSPTSPSKAGSRNPPPPLSPLLI